MVTSDRSTDSSGQGMVAAGLYGPCTTVLRRQSSIAKGYMGRSCWLQVCTALRADRVEGNYASCGARLQSLKLPAVLACKCYAESGTVACGQEGHGP